MFLNLKVPMTVFDASVEKGRATIPAGRHEVEVIENPLGFEAKWMVLKGTKKGMTESSLRSLHIQEEVMIED